MLAGVPAKCREKFNDIPEATGNFIKKIFRPAGAKIPARDHHFRPVERRDAGGPVSAIRGQGSIVVAAIFQYQDDFTMPIGELCSFPANITSPISWPRMFRALLANTQRSASTTLDFPHPFGPTIAVMPAGKDRVVLFLNDLKPTSSNCLIRICPTLLPPNPPSSSFLHRKISRDRTRKTCQPLYIVGRTKSRR